MARGILRFLFRQKGYCGQQQGFVQICIVRPGYIEEAILQINQVLLHCFAVSGPSPDQRISLTNQNDSGSIVSCECRQMNEVFPKLNGKRYIRIHFHVDLFYYTDGDCQSLHKNASKMLY